jgi:hypothetical protein
MNAGTVALSRPRRGGMLARPWSPPYHGGGFSERKVVDVRCVQGRGSRTRSRAEWLVRQPECVDGCYAASRDHDRA